MSLLLNENLPESLLEVMEKGGVAAHHVRALGLGGVSDRNIWRFAVERGLTIVTKDSDYIELQLEIGGAKLILVSVGNCRLAELKIRIESHVDSIRAFLNSDERTLVLK